MTPPTPRKLAYYHGGVPGLKVILPPSLTGAPSMANYASSACRRDRVYITTIFEAALLYAAGYPQGVVYAVEPVRPLENDLDCDMPGLSYACRKARVLRVYAISDEMRQAVLFAAVTP